MKAFISLEIFGDDSRQMVKFYTDLTNNLLPGIGDATFGKPPSLSSWIAEIVGEHAKYKVDRKFLKGFKNYEKSNSKGSRGVFKEYILESGKYYDIKEQVSWKKHQRYYAKVSDNGDLIKVEEDEVLKWVKSI